jgi:hypothetical protein
MNWKQVSETTTNHVSDQVLDITASLASALESESLKVIRVFISWIE